MRASDDSCNNAANDHYRRSAHRVGYADYRTRQSRVSPNEKGKEPYMVDVFNTLQAILPQPRTERATLDRQIAALERALDGERAEGRRLMLTNPA